MVMIILIKTLQPIHFRTHDKLRKKERKKKHWDLYFSGKPSSNSHFPEQEPARNGSSSKATRLMRYFSLLSGADVINFDGHVVLPYRFRNKKMKTLKDAIALKFKSSESEGVLLHGEGQQGDYITLEMKEAKLVLSLNLGLLSFSIIFPIFKMFIF